MSYDLEYDLEEALKQRKHLSRKGIEALRAALVGVNNVPETITDKLVCYFL